ncbi:competence protein ComEA [Glaciihabitans tibetensis]|uniref:Competence protein ComEA n=1 Tax=Glaciihabitans tibetensis TaxID=1266600 RepID=A0A2T0VJ11_9MICO|nr:ComEA family DNA-binding protein [Glaciihabitans tibetensis]PRY70190.1 competence protein ComEA [Glaciihabitans tibetensis]
MEITEAHQPRRRRLTIGAGVVLVLLAVAVAVLVAALSPHGGSTTIEPPSFGAGSGSGSAAAGSSGAGSAGDGSADAAVPPGGGVEVTDGAPAVFVHILGEVANPGLYELREGDRAIDAVAAAGGLTPAADETQLNLARFLNDGEQIVVPSAGAAPVAGAAPASPGGSPGTGTGAATRAGGAGVSGAGTISINSADAATLEDLPGLGPELAGRIVAWREANGPYSTVDDLLNVEGIGEKTVDGLRDSATV